MNGSDYTRPEPRPERTGHIRLGRYAGIPMRAHWTLLVILGLVTQLLAVGVLPAALPGRTTAGYWLAGAGAALAFLAAIGAHELAHAISARRYRVGVKHITLWMLGGVTELDDEPPSPRAEAAIAASGPLTSLALGAGFAGLAGLSTLVTGPGLLTAALGWLAGVNLLLGVFNLLPGAPLDGGRILRAVLWRRHRDRIRAAEASARAGAVVGMVIAGFGMAQLLFGSLLGLWLILIGWFMVGAANGERQAAGGRRLEGRYARDIMVSPPVVAPSWWTVAAFAEALGRGDGPKGAGPVFPLVDWDGAPSGLLTVRDLQRVPAEDRATVRLRDAARARITPLVVAPDTPLSELMVPIRVHGGVAVVVDGGQAVGTIHHADLASAAALAALAEPSGSPRAEAPRPPRPEPDAAARR